MADLADIVKDYLKGEDYTIQVGETLADVADRHGMTEDELKDYKADTAQTNAKRISDVEPAADVEGKVIKVPRLPANVAGAPASVTLPSDLVTTMKELWEKSIAIQKKTVYVAPNTASDFNLIYMDQEALEHGGTYSWNLASKKPDLFRTGPGTAGTFSANTDRAAGVYILGDFHTHPYTRFTDDDDNDACAFSGQDLKVTVGYTVFLDMVQSGKTIFLCMRTKETPRDSANNAKNDYSTVYTDERENQRDAKMKLTRDTRRDAMLKAAKQTCTDYKIAFYSGEGATVTKRS